jgi:hypothetical protein
MWLWGTELPGIFHEKSGHIGKVAIWVAMSSQGLIGPVFLNEMVSSKRYFHMLQNDFLPQLQGHWLASAEAAVNARWRYAAYCKRRAGIL